MDLHRTIREAASWRLAAALQRRHQGISIWNTHPGGGQYDVLCLTNKAGLKVSLNREGSIHLHADANGAPMETKFATWDRYMGADDPQLFVAEVERAVGLPVPSAALSTTRPMLVSRVISSLASQAILARPITITSAMHDSSNGSGLADWWPAVRSIAGELAEERSDDPLDPAYRFWRCERADLSIVLETSAARAWSSDGEVLDLMKTYRSSGSSLGQLMGEVWRLGQR